MSWKKKEVVKSMAKKCELSQTDCLRAVNAFIATVEEAALNDTSIHLNLFGNFEVKVLPERESENPWTKEKIIAAPKRQVLFKPHPTFKKSINRNIPGREKG